MFSALWMGVFGVGYLLHAWFQWRFTWPTAASALTATYFHIGALCFSWGFTPLLNPRYLTRGVLLRDLVYYIASVVVYWTVALLWEQAPYCTMGSFCLFFFYAVYITTVFYRTYNQVSFRLMRLSFGNVTGFVHWMQMCCDLIVLFGISSVVITGIFPDDIWPYSLLLVMGVGMFAYIGYSVSKYGTVIEEATKATEKANHINNL
jgi:hypothetical protein